jgi:hypothetical protein
MVDVVQKTLRAFRPMRERRLRSGMIFFGDPF